MTRAKMARARMARARMARARMARARMARARMARARMARARMARARMFCARMFCAKMGRTKLARQRANLEAFQHTPWATGRPQWGLREKMVGRGESLLHKRQGNLRPPVPGPIKRHRASMKL
jgi:hypothetical protein